MDGGEIIANTNLINAIGSVGTFLTFLTMLYFIYIEHRKIRIKTKSKIYYSLYRDVKSLIDKCEDYRVYPIFLKSLRGIEPPGIISDDVYEVNDRLKSYHDELQATKERIKGKLLSSLLLLLSISADVGYRDGKSKEENLKKDILDYKEEGCTSSKSKNSSLSEILEKEISLSETLAEVTIRPLLKGKTNISPRLRRNKYKGLYDDILSCGISDNEIEDIFCMLREENFPRVIEEQEHLIRCSKELKKN